MIQPYQTVKIQSSQNRPVIYYPCFSTKLQEMEEMEVSRLSAYVSQQRYHNFYFGTIAMVSGLPKVNYVQDSNMTDEYNRHHPGFLAKQVREKSSLGSCKI